MGKDHYRFSRHPRRNKFTDFALLPFFASSVGVESTNPGPSPIIKILDASMERMSRDDYRGAAFLLLAACVIAAAGSGY
ncbi:hypothetical protein [Phytopseudomonas punonensis]|uniref:hypothetical protein n=1 Tax=Phytopseudomonas punonensis TaxID=1220495 RepID=UPI001114F27A|nr:hypothetical protein [Pseudomonas punonensis]